MKYIISTAILFLFLPVLLSSQVVYSYVTDRKFKDPTDLLGYNFVPYRLEIKDEKEENISAGSYSFGITQNNLYVTGKDIEGVYSINNINPTKFGYQLTLMNARNPALQGHLKVVVNNRKQVEALIFKRSTKDKETIFLLSPLSEDQKAKEEKYYTDKNELIIDHPDSLWGKSIYPFLGLFKANGKQEKFLTSDSVFVKFEKRTTIIEKKLKEKKPKKPKKEKKKDEAVKDEVAKEESVNANDENEEVDKEKLEKEKLEKEIEEKKIAEEENEAVKDDKTDIIDDSAEAKPKEEEEMQSDTMPQSPKVKTKIIIQDYVILRQRIKYDDGTFEDKKNEFKIGKITVKEDKEAKDDEEKYQLTISPSGASPFYIYLTGNKAVNSIEFADKLYLVKGN